MTPNEFIIWLNGFVEMTEASSSRKKGLEPAQWDLVKSKLAIVRGAGADLPTLPAEGGVPYGAGSPAVPLKINAAG